MERQRSATILGVLVLGQGLVFVMSSGIMLALLSPALREVLTPVFGSELPEVRLSQILLAVTHLILGLVGLVSGVGIVQVRSWAWLMAMIAQGLNLSTELFNYTQGEAQYLSMVVSVGIVFYLNQRDVQRVFQSFRRQDNAPGAVHADDADPSQVPGQPDQVLPQ